jgi:hypothetical protein
MVELIAHRDRRIVYGITLRNEGRWSARGWTLHPASDVTPSEVRRAKEALSEQLGFEASRLIVARQVHGSSVAIVENNAPTDPADALVTTAAGTLLCVSVADCCAVLLRDDEQSLVAAVHSGWRGTAANIVGATVRLIEHRFGIHSRRLRAWLSPCASGERYIVREDVAALFPNSITRIGEDQYLFDNPSEICRQLLDAGLDAGSIEHSGFCTIGDERFHSYRRDGDRSGRMAAFIGIAVSGRTL